MPPAREPNEAPLYIYMCDLDTWCLNISGDMDS
jgi:hypothetical protein